MAFVYILSTQTGKYYIGSTTNLLRRLQQHTVGHTHSTKRLGKATLVFSQEYPTLFEARFVELKLKNFKRRDYIERIIEDGFIKIKPKKKC